MLVSARATPAPDAQVLAEIQNVLKRRGDREDPPISLAVSDAAALGIAGLFTGPTPTGEVLGRFFHGGSVDSDELIEAATTEQGYASPEGHAALYCLIGWVRGRLDRLDAP